MSTLKVSLEIPILDIVELFRSAGFIVCKKEISLDFKTSSGMNYKDLIITWVIINPVTLKAELFEPYARKYLEISGSLYLNKDNSINIKKIFEYDNKRQSDEICR